MEVGTGDPIRGPVLSTMLSNVADAASRGSHEVRIEPLDAKKADPVPQQTRLVLTPRDP